MLIPATPQTTVGHPDCGSGLWTNKTGRSRWLSQVHWCSLETLSTVSQMNAVGCCCCRIGIGLFLGTVQAV